MSLTQHIEEKKEQVNYNANEIIYSHKWEEFRDEEYFKYRKSWSEYPKKRFVSDFPLHLDIETTDLCNLRCPMCSRTIMDEHENTNKKKYITKEEYINIIDQAVAHGVKSIKLQYLGEPLLHKDIIFQVEYAKKKGIVDVMFNTNAVLLTKDMSKQLLEAGLDKLFISFDAVNPKLYEQQRVGTTIGKVIDNIYNFINLRNEISPKTYIRLSMVMYDDPIWQKQFEAMKIMWDGLVDALGYGLFNERDKYKRVEFEKVDGFVCEQIFQRMFLKCNGKVTICCTDEYDTFDIGNWREEKLFDLWNNEKYKEIRMNHMNNNYDRYETCKKCFMPDVYKKAFLNKK
jgi:radical SAM protein with 4Fe4S-binding SPASM domain